MHRSHSPLLPALTLALAAPFTQADPPAGDGGLCRLILEHDRELQAAALEELAVWRRQGDREAFAARGSLLRERIGRLAAPLEAQVEALGLELVGRTDLVPSLLVRLDDGATFELLAQLDGVTDVVLDSKRGAALGEAILAHGIKALHGTSLGGQALEGSGVTIAVLDSGVDLDMGGSGRPHAAFYPDGDSSASGPGIGGSRILSSSYHGLQGFCPPIAGEDESGHGTRVAAIAAGADWSIALSSSDGAAPAANLRSYKITDCSVPIASTLAMADALDKAVLEPDVRVVNLSFDGTSSPAYSFNEDLDAAVLAGVSTVVSAGNFGSSKTFMHGAFDVVSVGASFLGSKQPYSFPGFMESAVGPLPDGRSYPSMLAVGEQITCAAMDDESGAIDSYGSSGAAALVSGTAALLYQSAPTLEPLEVKALLLHHAAPLDGGDPDAGGFGFLDALAAQQAAAAGAYSSGALRSGEEARFALYALAGEPLAFTLVTARATALYATDFDLALAGPDGALLADSSESRDNAERLEAIAPTTGVYTLVVRPKATFAPTAARPFAIAGVSGSPVVVPDPTLALPGPNLASISEAAFDWGSGGQVFYVKGLGLAATTSVSVAGQQANFSFQAPARLKVEVPSGLTGDNLVVAVTGPATSDVGFVSIGSSGPKLVVPTINFEDVLKWRLEGAPSAAFWVATSLSASGTDLPGIAQLSIGNAGLDLVLIGQGLLDAQGAAEAMLSGLGGLPDNLTFYFQGLTFDGSQGLFEVSNVASALSFTHFL